MCIARWKPLLRSCSRSSACLARSAPASATALSEARPSRQAAHSLSRRRGSRLHRVHRFMRDPDAMEFRRCCSHARRLSSSSTSSHVELYAAHEERMRLHGVQIAPARTELQAHAQLRMLHLFPGLDQPRPHQVVAALQVTQLVVVVGKVDRVQVSRGGLVAGMEVRREIDAQRQHSLLRLQHEMAAHQTIAGLAVLVGQVQMRGRLAQRVLHGGVAAPAALARLRRHARRVCRTSAAFACGQARPCAVVPAIGPFPTVNLLIR